MAIAVTSAAIIVLASNSIAASKQEEGTTAYYAAESGAENAMLELLRNPNYTGETLQIGTASVSAQITPGPPITIISQHRKEISFEKYKSRQRILTTCLPFHLGMKYTKIVKLRV